MRYLLWPPNGVTRVPLAGQSALRSRVSWQLDESRMSVSAIGIDRPNRN